MSLGGDTAQGIDALGRQLAGKRGSAAIPRAVRMTADERAKAHAYMLAVEFGLDTEVERRAPDAMVFERMLGLRSGQGGGLAATLEPAGGIDDLIALPPSARMRDAIASASVAEFELARRMGGFLQVGIPSLVPWLLAEEGPKAKPFARIIEATFADVAPRAIALFVIVTLTKLHANARTEDDIRDAMKALAPGSMEVALLELLPAGRGAPRSITCRQRAGGSSKPSCAGAARSATLDPRRLTPQEARSPKRVPEPSRRSTSVGNPGQLNTMEAWLRDAKALQICSSLCRPWFGSLSRGTRRPLHASPVFRDVLARDADPE